MPSPIARSPRRFWLIPALGALCCSGLALAQGSLYRWVDDSGAVHYTDSVPADESKQGHTKLSEQGVRTEEVAPAPTEAELQKAKEAERLKQEEERRVAARKEADARLLSRYRTAEEVELTRDGKLAGVDALIRVKRDLIRSNQERRLKLETRKKEALQSGKPLPPELENDIAQTESKIRANYAAIIDLERQKDAIRQEFRGILKQYLELRRLPLPTESTDGKTDGGVQNLVACTGMAECGRYWERAMTYVREHSEAKTEILGPGLLIAFQEDDKEERTFTLTWTQAAADRPVHLYLDLQCKNKQTGSLNCIEASANAVEEEFRAAVTQD
ncbi:DUF4124 domain-containing protein [Thiorhodococcus fuscus]|uniref:DUF4124 domain-containing protein n=1 Tax=Thiorhodococcus fuscus TaxID=527200 RepID=A0ABW4YE30_9GAMM